MHLSTVIGFTLIPLAIGNIPFVDIPISAATPVDSVQSPKPAPPLAPLLTKRLLILPAQRLSFHDSLGWSTKVSTPASYLKTIDDEMTFAFAERGVAKEWIFPKAIAKSAKRNASMTADPYTLAVDPIRIGLKVDRWQLDDPLAGQIRSLIALNDARYVLIPVELQFANAKTPGLVEPRLHLVVIDARRAQVQWVGDIVGTPTETLSPAVVADVVSRFAELVAPLERAQPH